MLSSNGDAATNPNAVRYQKLKTEIHKRVVQTLDLTQLPLWKPEQVRRKVCALPETLGLA